MFNLGAACCMISRTYPPLCQWQRRLGSLVQVESCFASICGMLGLTVSCVHGSGTLECGTDAPIGALKEAVERRSTAIVCDHHNQV